MPKVWKAFAVAALFSITLAACSGADADDDVATLGGGDAAEPTASPSVDPEDALAEFAECMRENGIEDFPDPQVNDDGGIVFGGPAGGGGEGRPDAEDRERLEAAMGACQDLLPQGEGRGSISPEEQAEFQDALVNYAQCMRDHGIDMPDPEFADGGGVTQQVGDGVDPNDPEFQAADEECAHFLQGVGPRSEEATDGETP